MMKRKRSDWAQKRNKSTSLKLKVLQRTFLHFLEHSSTSPSETGGSFWPSALHLPRTILSSPSFLQGPAAGSTQSYNSHTSGFEFQTVSWCLEIIVWLDCARSVDGQYKAQGKYTDSHRRISANYTDQTSKKATRPRPLSNETSRLTSSYLLSLANVQRRDSTFQTW